MGDPSFLARAGGLLQRAMLIASAVGIAVSLTVFGVFVFNPRKAEELTSGLRPTLFHSELPTDLIDPNFEPVYEQILGVAHNSGDSVSATLSALASGADAIELDVVSMNGQLYSSHASPLPFIGSGVFRGPSLETIWAAAAQTDIIKFDLKETSPQFRSLVRAFLLTHRREHQVVVASHDPATLRYFADQMPEIIRLYSVGGNGEFSRLQDDPDLAAMINGVSIRHTLVDEETAAWLNEHELLIVTWTVNTLERANDLIDLGADAITTDNLALLALFGGQRRGEADLEHDQDATPVPSTALAPPIDRDARWPLIWPRPRKRHVRIRPCRGILVSVRRSRCWRYAHATRLAPRAMAI
jgi:hypothetical protein